VITAMPLTHRKDGWYWGSKGPFDSKAKALSVARAAFASGYKGEQKKDELIIQERKIPALFKKY
jgi:hypothetical protein